VYKPIKANEKEYVVDTRVRAYMFIVTVLGPFAILSRQSSIEHPLPNRACLARLVCSPRVEATGHGSRLLERVIFPPGTIVPI
jgi:hypothetical protein